MLFLTGTTLNVPSLMGAIMSIGVATANSVLVITFANERLADTKDAFRSALEAGSTRQRPVMMTALAMIIGMVPMALGLDEEANRMRPSAARSSAGCSSPPSPPSSLFQSCSPCCAVGKNRKTWLQGLREDSMAEQLETPVTKDRRPSGVGQRPSGADQQKPASRSKGRRLLWFLVIPAVLACSAFVTVYGRRESNESLAATNGQNLLALPGRRPRVSC
jgi:hypothetical protein